MNVQQIKDMEASLYASLETYSNLGYTVPGNDHGGLVRWIVHGIVPGGFLQAVLANNLKEAYATADEGNTRNLYGIVSWLYNNAPRGCWGYPECLTQWKGLKNGE